jgi:uncharacterized phage protein (TIGR02218 family)
MKARSAGLITHHNEPVNTRAWCWKITRRDAQVFGFTSTDVSLIVGGVTYEASTGFTPSAIDGRADLSVPNLDVTGLLDSASITESDLLAGRWDGAAVEVFEVNYTNLSDGAMNLRTGTIGGVSAGRTMFTAELRGLAQTLQQPVGELFSPSCPATLGDSRCKVPLGPLTVTGTVTAATSARAFSDSWRSEVDDYFGAGLITWTVGLNSGLVMEVRDYTQSGGVFMLALPMPYTVQVGDTYSLIPGCRKRGLIDCKTKYNNIVNFRGFPNVPGNDKVLGNAALANA